MSKRRRNPETEIQTQITGYLQAHGFYCIRNHQTLGSHKGLSDMTVIKESKTVYIEVKTAKGKQSEDQEKFQRAIEEHGGHYVILRSLHEAVDFVALFNAQLLEQERDTVL